MRMIDTPVLGSPARIAAATGAAPRQRGRSEPCTLTPPCGGTVEQRRRDDLAIGGHNQHVGCKRHHLGDALRCADALGAQDGQAELGRRLRDGARRRPAARAGAVGLGHHGGDVVGAGQGAQ